ncbi:hypothetical protein AX15_003082 [Amanita polypyramis BW_CC]|nr:hypothetical protein AX15_003082 [Amanita polypyramis BW_CC]
MQLLLVFIAAFLPLNGLAGGPTGGRARHSRLAHSIKGRNAVKNFTVQDYYTGQSFLDDWEFFSGDDPTHGNVKYLSKGDAVAKNLSYVQSDGTTVLAVDDYSVVPEGSKRNSVRIQTKKSYSSGLFIADFWSMPHGCSVWPAYWSSGRSWPNDGEIDIIEGVNNGPTNQYTLHSGTGSNCTLSTAGTQVLSSVMHDICASSDSDNRGCGFLDGNTTSFGRGFNIVGGGVFAHLWDNSGIKMWHFSRDQIPADITAKNPNPASWPAPVAFWSSTTCDIGAHFFDHNLVLDTTVCGDWAGPAYGNSGCSGTCGQAVANNTNFLFAKWKINYIAVYQ